MNPDLDTLVCALYVRIDDLLAANPHWAPQRPAVGIAPRLSDAELVTLAVLQALLGSILRPASSAGPTRIWGRGSGMCPSGRATTSGCAAAAS